MSEYTVCTITAFLCLAWDWVVFREDGAGPPPPCESGIIVSLVAGICEALHTTGVTALLREIGFDLALDYMAYCQSQDDDWSCCSSNWFPYNF